MRESDTFQAILEEGREEGIAIGEARGEVMGAVKEARNLLLRLGRKRFGEPDAQTQKILDSITTVEELERLADRLLEVESWDELLRVR